MSIYKKVQAVNKIYNLLEKDIAKFQYKCELKCFEGCGHCCQKNDIEATVLEFLPYAYFQFKNGNALNEYNRLIEKKHENLCFILSDKTIENSTGFCSLYKYRPLICRLFGFSAITDKYENVVLSTCKIIKDKCSYQYSKVVNDVKKYNIPLNTNYYYQLSLIDIDLCTQFYPINQAIIKSLETVLSYYSYRKKPVNAA
jgi:Fe-S-cluster containining protein